MTNQLPEQFYVARFAMKSGATFDIITKLTDAEVEALLNSGSPRVAIPGENVQKHWPVILYIDPKEIAFYIHAPHEQYLAGRKIVQS